MAKKMQKE